MKTLCAHEDTHRCFGALMVQASPELLELRDALLQGAMPYYPGGGSRGSSAGQQPLGGGDSDACGRTHPLSQWPTLYPLVQQQCMLGQQQQQQAAALNSSSSAAAAFMTMLSSASNVVSAESQSTMPLYATGSAAVIAVTSGSRHSDVEVQQSLLEMVMGRRPLPSQASPWADCLHLIALIRQGGRGVDVSSSRSIIQRRRGGTNQEQWA